MPDASPSDLEQAKAKVLNASLSDGERVSALWKIVSSNPGLGRKALPEFFDRAVIAAIVRLGTSSEDAEMRGAIWAYTRNFVIDDPSLLQALIRALATDPDENVRSQAALSLNPFLAMPGVLQALQRAAAQDPSRESKEPCCVLTVREAAQRASIANKDFRAWSRSTLLDESLPARSRLLPVSGRSDDGRVALLAESEVEAARAVFDIGRREEDPRVRAIAWDSLASAAPNEAFVPVLTGDLVSHPDTGVRIYAAKALEKYAGNPDVRRAFEAALIDQSIDVRRVAISVMERARSDGNAPAEVAGDFTFHGAQFSASRIAQGRRD